MKLIKGVAVALAAGILVTSLVACSNDAGSVDVDSSEGSSVEVESLGAGTYEGYGFKVSYDESFWTNMYNDESSSDSGYTISSLRMYNSDFSSSAEILRSDGQLTSADEFYEFFADEAAAQENYGNIVSDYNEEVTDEYVSVSFVVSVPSYIYDDDGNVIEGEDSSSVNEFYLRYDAFIDGDYSIIVSIASIIDDYTLYSEQFDQLVETVEFSDVLTAGDVYNEESQYYNYSPETSIVDNCVYLNQTVYQDANGDDRVGYTLDDGLSNSLYTYKDSLTFDSYGVYGYIYTITALVEDIDPAESIYSNVSNWYAAVTDESSTYFVSEITADPETITTNDDGIATYIMAYAPMESVATVDEDGNVILDDSGMIVYEYADMAGDVFVNIFHVKSVDDAIEYSSFEITRSEMTDESLDVIKELCDTLEVSYEDVEYALTYSYGTATVVE